jgi:hypothetical protein
MVDWFIARNGKVEGPLTREAVVDAARFGELGRDAQVWQPGADTWQCADDVVALWADPLEPPTFQERVAAGGSRATWQHAAAVALMVSASALLLVSAVVGPAERKEPRSPKLDCSLAHYLEGKCR